jgi:hypothetical protein
MHNAGARKKAPSSPTRVKLSLSPATTQTSGDSLLSCAPFIITSRRSNKTQRKNPPKPSPSLLSSLPPSLHQAPQRKMKTTKTPRERERERKKERLQNKI